MPDRVAFGRAGYAKLAARAPVYERGATDFIASLLQEGETPDDGATRHVAGPVNDEPGRSQTNPADGAVEHRAVGGIAPGGEPAAGARDAVVRSSDRSALRAAADVRRRARRASHAAGARDDDAADRWPTPPGHAHRAALVVADVCAVGNWLRHQELESLLALSVVVLGRLRRRRC